MHTNAIEIDISEIKAVWDDSHNKYITTHFLKSGMKGKVVIKVKREKNPNKIYVFFFSN